MVDVSIKIVNYVWVKESKPIDKQIVKDYRVRHDVTYLNISKGSTWIILQEIGDLYILATCYPKTVRIKVIYDSQWKVSRLRSNVWLIFMHFWTQGIKVY